MRRPSIQDEGVGTLFGEGEGRCGIFQVQCRSFGVFVAKAVDNAIVAEVSLGVGVSSFKGGPFFKRFFISI